MIEFLHTKRSLDGAGGQRYIGDLQPQPRVLGKQQPIMSGYEANEMLCTHDYT